MRATNTSQEPIGDIAFVVDSLAAGWSLLNGDGVTEDYAPAGMPYKNVPTLAAGQSSTFTLQFKRTGTLPFGYVTRVITASGKG
ncbi:MAG: hypothetical protein JNK87_27630 [Bryobacterales bacterium]|nr:hypothetical protein [Bryobacterales bacterium]